MKQFRSGHCAARLYASDGKEDFMLQVGQEVEWLTRPVPGVYLRGIVLKLGTRKVGIAVQSPKTGEWKPKWAEPKYLRKV